MKLFKAVKDVTGFHYLVQIDENKPPEGINLRAFDWTLQPPAGFTEILSETDWVRLHQREMKVWLETMAFINVSPTPQKLPDEGQTL